MHYIFFETGNKNFFSSIVRKFGLLFLQFVVDNYSKPNSNFIGTKGFVDMVFVEAFFAQHEDVFEPLSCVLFSTGCPSFHCGDNECTEDDRKVVLASDQAEKFGQMMTAMIKKVVESSSTHQTRFNLQRIFQGSGILNDMLEKIKIIAVKKKGKHGEYLRLYIKNTDRFKNEADGFVYVRAANRSDYQHFAANTALPNVNPCDSFSAPGVL